MNQLRPDFFDSLGKPNYEPALRNMHAVDYSETRMPPAGSFSTVVNREAEHISK